MRGSGRKEAWEQVWIMLKEDDFNFVPFTFFPFGIISMQKSQINGHIELSVNVLLLLQYQIMLAIMFPDALGLHCNLIWKELKLHLQMDKN